jgi:hypothetical protein
MVVSPCGNIAKRKVLYTHQDLSLQTVPEDRVDLRDRGEGRPDLGQAAASRPAEGTDLVQRLEGEVSASGRLVQA